MLYTVIRESYSTILCTIIILVTLVLNRKKYEKKVSILFLITILLAFVETIAGSAERYIANSANYHPMRLVLSWACYIIAPAILLSVAETILRNAKARWRWIIAIPEFVNIAVTSTAFFAPWCFRMDAASNRFCAGPLIDVPRYSILVYLIIVVVVAFLNVRQSKQECITVLILAALIAFNFYDETSLHILNNVREVTIAISILAYFMHFITMHHVEEIVEINDEFARSEEKLTKEMLDQAIETLAYTIDAKDRYTKGHSSRVAKYSRMIASVVGKSDEECRQIYLAGLLHDIGKISINGAIINKTGRLTEEEYEKIKKHPTNGALILEKMKSIPFLQNGAKFHHERYDGKGYPLGLKGGEIPEMARIIAVADAYDAMTSIRSYRDVMEQVEVKQEMWRGMGTQFDPLFAKTMISLIDADVNYDMREKPGELDEIIFEDINTTIVWPTFPEEQKSSIDILQDTDLNTLAAFVAIEDKWSKPIRETLVTNSPVIMSFHSVTLPEAKYLWNAPAVIVYSSDNGKVLGPGYDELGVFMSAGYGWQAGSSLYEYSSFTRKEAFTSWDDWQEKNRHGMDYVVHAYREKDMIVLTIENDLLTFEAHLALDQNHEKPVYFTAVGEHCRISCE